MLDLIVRLLAPQGLAAVAAALKRALALASPHYNLARGLYDVHSSYSGGGFLGGGRGGQMLFWALQPTYN